MIRYIRAKISKWLCWEAQLLDSRCDMVHINDMMAAYEGMKYLLEMGTQEDTVF